MDIYSAISKLGSDPLCFLHFYPFIIKNMITNIITEFEAHMLQVRDMLFKYVAANVAQYRSCEGMKGFSIVKHYRNFHLKWIEEVLIVAVYCRYFNGVKRSGLKVGLWLKYCMECGLGQTVNTYISIKTSCLFIVRRPKKWPVNRSFNEAVS